MKFLLMFLLQILIISSCSSTMFIKKNSASLKELNDILEGEEATITLQNGDEITTENILVYIDSTIIDNNKVATSTIRQIKMSSPGGGSLKGMGYGSLLGIVFGVSIIAVAGSCAFGVCAFGLIIGLPLLGIIGGITGGIHGDIDTFIFLNERGSAQSVKIVRVEISAIIEESEEYIIVLYDGNNIRLEKSEYLDLLKSEDGKHFVVIPKKIFQDKFGGGKFNRDIEESPPQKDPVFSQNIKIIRVEISEITKETEEYINIMYNGRNIRLQRSEYKNIIESDDGKLSIVIPKEVYLQKFE